MDDKNEYATKESLEVVKHWVKAENASIHRLYDYVDERHLKLLIAILINSISIMILAIKILCSR